MVAKGVEGELLIDLHWRNGVVTEAAVSSTRPLRMPKVFIGKPFTEVLSTLPLIYNICGMAQGCAAIQAVEQALPRPASLSLRRKRRMLVAFETIKEQLWRIELDWARFLDRAPDHGFVAQILKLMREFRATLFSRVDPFLFGGLETDVNGVILDSQLDELEYLLKNRVFSEPTQRWLDLADRQALSQWSGQRETLAQEMIYQVQQRYPAGFGRNRIHPLPEELEPEYLQQRFCADDAELFIAQPDWLGSPRETSSFTRRCSHPLIRDLSVEHGNGLLPRLAARLIELAELVQEIRSGYESLYGDDIQPATELAAGTGISQVDAARGRLVHRVELDGDQVANYQILAPTEWNFHSRGVLVESLQGIPTDSAITLRSTADLLITSIDPCVGYRLMINGEQQI